MADTLRLWNWKRWMQNSIHSANGILCESRRVPVSGENLLPQDLQRYLLVPFFWWPSLTIAELWQNGQECTSREFSNVVSRSLCRLCFEWSHLDMFPMISLDSSSIISSSENWDFKVLGPYGLLLLFMWAVSVVGGQTRRNRQVSEPHLSTNESLSVIDGWLEYYNSEERVLSPMCKSVFIYIDIVRWNIILVLLIDLTLRRMTPLFYWIIFFWTGGSDIENWVLEFIIDKVNWILRK